MSLERKICLVGCIILVILCFIPDLGRTKTGTVERKVNIDEIETEAKPEEYHLFREVDKEAYKKFLSEFDESKYTIIGISTSMKNDYDGSDEFYNVTYRNRKPGDPYLLQGITCIEVYQTFNEEEFFDALENMTYEKIIDISTSMQLDHDGSDEFYAITYGE